MFGAGLAVSGMMDPAKVRGFLDIFGNWDPTLAFVMGGATLVMGIAWLIQGRFDRPLADSRFHLPKTIGIDRRLVAGSALFGIGWGLAGLCPGPGLASLAIRPLPAAIFVAAMIAGMAVFRLTTEQRD
ncbi:MAG: YeeE/YedE family protein [Sphingomonas sp.]|nr:YeeE/YedE family protein [Sphingomonas sp.]